MSPSIAVNASSGAISISIDDDPGDDLGLFGVVTAAKGEDCKRDYMCCAHQRILEVLPNQVNPPAAQFIVSECVVRGLHMH